MSDSFTGWLVKDGDLWFFTSKHPDGLPTNVRRNWLSVNVDINSDMFQRFKLLKNEAENALMKLDNLCKYLVASSKI